VQADYSIECGADDECLEMPWASEDGKLRYIDLKLDPARILDLEEATLFPELADFLRLTNSSSSVFQTAKCDAGFTHDLTMDDEVFGTEAKFWCYVDLLFTSPIRLHSFEQHEASATNLVRLLHRAPEMPAAAEFLLRRCYSAEDPSQEGFYFTCYVFGYSDSQAEARQHWGIALRLVAGALADVSVGLNNQV